MMSLSSHRDAITTSEQAAEPRSVRPRPETPAPGGLLGRPDLLERRPVVRRALRSHEPGRIRPLEAEVHLQAAVVGAASVRPAALVAVDAEERRFVRRMRGLAPGRRGTPLPQPNGPLDV